MKADRSDAAAYFAVNRKTSDVVKYEDVVRYFAVWGFIQNVPCSGKLCQHCGRADVRNFLFISTACANLTQPDTCPHLAATQAIKQALTAQEMTSPAKYLASFHKTIKGKPPSDPSAKSYPEYEHARKVCKLSSKVCNSCSTLSRPRYCKQAAAFSSYCHLYAH